MGYTVVSVFYIFPLIHLALQCSKSSCLQGKICMEKLPIIFVGSTVEVCCTLTGSLAGESIVFKCLGTSQSVETSAQSSKVCATFFANSTNSIGSMCNCSLKQQQNSHCKDEYLLRVETSMPETLPTECYTQLQELVCLLTTPRFLITSNVKATLYWDVLQCKSTGIKSIPCDGFTSCRLNLYDVSVLSNDCILNVSITLTYNQTSPHASKSISSPWFQLDPSTIEKLKIRTLETKNINSSCFTLSWKLLEDFLDEVTVTAIQVESKWSNTRYINQRQENHRSETICHLLPFTLYTVTLSTRLDDSTIWSDAVNTSVLTLAEEPLCGPEVSPGGYHVIKRDGSSFAIVYWKMPADRDWQSDTGLGYNVYQQTVGLHANFVQTMSLDKNKSSLEALLPKQSNILMYIKSKNNIGEAVCSTNVFTLSADKKISALSGVQAVWRKDSVEVSWTLTTSSNSKATIFWCKMSEKTDICNSQINWKDSHNNTSGKINISLAAAQIHQYGVSIEDFATKRFSEITWSSCLKAYQDGSEIISGNCLIPPEEKSTAVDLIVVAGLFPGLVILALILILIKFIYSEGQKMRGRLLSSNEPFLPNTENNSDAPSLEFSRRSNSDGEKDSCMPSVYPANESSKDANSNLLESASSVSISSSTESYSKTQLKYYLRQAYMEINNESVVSTASSTESINSVNSNDFKGTSSETLSSCTEHTPEQSNLAGTRLTTYGEGRESEHEINGYQLITNVA